VIGATSATTGTPATDASKNTPALGERSTGLGRDAFLQLLVTQLGHQNPMAPQADGEFIAQLAQFSALEQLTTMNTTLTRVADALGVEPVEKKVEKK
jgi:flagellar basal-body rod modification protein FlgD